MGQLLVILRNDTVLVIFQSIPLCIRWSETLSFSKPDLKEKYSVHSHAQRAPSLFDPQENLTCVYLISALVKTLLPSVQQNS